MNESKRNQSLSDSTTDDVALVQTNQIQPRHHHRNADMRIAEGLSSGCTSAPHQATPHHPHAVSRVTSVQVCTTARPQNVVFWAIQAMPHQQNFHHEMNGNSN
jgi:hypothetical protein